jgi:fructose-1,6-bisphosphatase/inositol monophosphatase family enzyme
LTESTGEFRPETLVAVEAVKRAFAVARGGIAAEDVTVKGARVLVTAADLAVEDLVRGVVGDALGFSVIGEERGGNAAADGSLYWLVDPICGTRNFASGIPLYCVNPRARGGRRDIGCRRRQSFHRRDRCGGAAPRGVEVD